MLYRVFLGSISQRGRDILVSYLNEFLPEHIIEDLSVQGIRTKIKREAGLPDVGLIILDEHLYSTCKGVASGMLSLSKVHRYTSDDSLYEFLISKFGRKLDTVDSILSGDIIPSVAGGTVCVSESDEDMLLLAGDDSDASSQIAELKESNRLLKAELDAVSGSSTSDEAVSIYSAKISELEKALRAKEAELSASKNDGFVDLGKVAKAEQVMAELDELKAELKSVRRSMSQLEFDNSINSESIVSLEKEKREKDEEIVRLRGIELDSKSLSLDISRMRDEIADTEKERDSLLSKTEDLQSSLSSVESELEALRLLSSDRQILEDRVNELEPQFLKSKEDIKALHIKLAMLAKVESEFASCKLELEKLVARNTELVKVNSTLSEIKGELEQQSEFFASKNESLQSEVTKLEMSLSSLSSKDSELEKSIELLEAKTVQLSKDKSDLSTSLSDSRALIEAKEEELSALELRLSESDADTNSVLEGHRAELQSKDETISELVTKVQGLESSIEATSLEVSANLEGKDEKIRELNESLSGVEQRLETEVSNSKMSLESKDNEIAELKTKLSDLVFSYKDAEQKLLSFSDVDLSSINSEKAELALTLTKAQEELVSSKRKIAILEEQNKSIVESTVSKVEFSSVTALKTELELSIANLKTENLRLSEQGRANKDGVQTREMEYSKLQEEIDSLRAKLELRDITLIEKDQLLDEVTSSIFCDMAKTAQPKIAMQLAVPVPKVMLENVVVVAGGSVGSISDMYKFIKTEVTSRGDVPTVVVDISNMSSIDSMLGLRSIVSPLDWLRGTEPIGSLIGDYASSKVSVLTSAGSYIYEPYKLNIDWMSRLVELNNLGVKVILCIGSIDSTINGVLYNSFSKCCESFIVVASSPANLRGAILTMTGFRSIENTTVICRTFAEPSKALYNKLASKVRTRIVQDDECISV